MMNLIDLRQQKTINIISVVVGGLTVAVAIMAYLENKKHKKVNEEMVALDKEIKLLQLQKLRRENGIL